MTKGSFFHRIFINAVLLGILTCLFMSTSYAVPKSDKHNIIFFIADDMQPYMFNCLPEGKGRNLTPSIDRLAREGTILVGQHVASPVCTPSRYNCLTGRYASRAGNVEFVNFTKKNESQTVIQWNSFITSKDMTLPAILHQNGYTTGIVGKNHVVEVRDFAPIPDYHADATKPEIVSALKQRSEKIIAAMQEIGFDYAASVYHNNPNWIGLKSLASHNMDWVTEGGLAFIDQCKDKPFFLYFATTIPHGPQQAERSWKADRRITANGFLDEPLAVLPSAESIEKRLKRAGLFDNERAMLLWMDDALGALLDKLKEHGLDENTWIFFFNDHGQQAKGTLYQGGVLNPSIVWKKGGFACGLKTDAIVSNVDFAPTILDAANIQYDKNQFDGRSFIDVLNGGDLQDKLSLYFELGYARGIRKGDWKYIAIRYPDSIENMSLKQRAKALDEYNQQRKFMGLNIVNEDPSKPLGHLEAIPGGGVAEHSAYGNYPGYFDRDQLYNLANDPTEQNNLAKDPQYQNKLDEMKHELKQYLETLPGHFILSQTEKSPK